MIKRVFNSYKKTSIQAKAALWYSICNVLQKGISFIVVPIYVHLLTTSEYGQYTAFQSWRDILVIVVTLNLYCGVFTKAMVDYKNDQDKYISCMQGLTTILVLFWVIIYFIGKNVWNELFDMDTITILLLFFYYLTHPSFSFWSVRQRVEYRYKTMVIATIIMSILVPVVSILLLCLTSLRAKAVIWGFLIIQSLVGFAFYIYQFAKGKSFFDKEYWIHALRFNIPLIPHYLSLIVLSQADRLMIKDMCGLDKTGIYGLAYSVAMLMNILTSAINNSVVPWIYEKLKDKDYGPIKSTTNKLLLFIGGFTFLVILISPEIVKIIGTIDYYDAIWIIPPVSISVYFTFCYGFYSNVEFYYNRTKYVMVASSAGAIINIVLNFIFIRVYGYIAAGYTTLISYFILMLMHYLYTRKIYKEETKNIKVYDDKFIFGSSAILVLAMIISLVVYSSNIIRYALIALIVFIVLQKKDTILKLIKDFL